MLMYNMRDTSERYNMPDSLKAQYTAHLTKGNVLMSDNGRVLASIVQDSLGWHDSISGYTTRAMTDEKYGKTTYQECGNDWYRSGEENFKIELIRNNMSARDLVPCVNLFSKVYVEEDGNMHYEKGHYKKGDTVTLRTEMDIIFIVSNTPIQLLTLEQAETIRTAQKENLAHNYTLLDEARPNGHTKAELLEKEKLDYHYAVLAKDCVAETEIVIRLAGEENVLVEYGEMELSIDLRFRVHILMRELEKTELPIINLTPGIRSQQVNFDIEKISAREMTEKILEVNKNIPELENITVPSRIVTLPLSWDDPQTQLAAKRYQETVRENAPWCPSNPEFIRRINGLDSIEEVKKIVFDANYLVLGLGDVYLGAPVAAPIDPRHRMVTTKYNPARPWTPENAVGIGGAYLCVYGMEGPGGYQFVGRTIQMWNPLKETEYFRAGKPWLLNFFDQIKFYPVSRKEILEDREAFLRGRFKISIEETEFSFGEYKKFLEDNKDTIKMFKEHQEASFEAERQRWREQRLDEFVSETEEMAAIVEEKIPDGCVAARTNIPGSVWKILVEEGSRVKKGDTLAVLESMKMEFPIEAECNGVVEKIHIRTGELVNAGQLAVCIRE